jgi:MFS family permease
MGRENRDNVSLPPPEILGAQAHGPPSSIPRRVKWFVLLVFFTAVGYGYLQILISAYLPEVGYDAGSVGLILGANGIAIVLGSVPFGIYADRKGKKRILIIGLMGFPLTLLVFALTTELPALLIAGVLAGLGEGAFLSSWNALIADMTTVSNRERAFTLSFIVGTSAFGLGYVVPLVFPALEALLGVGLVDIHRYSTVVLAALSVVSPLGIAQMLKDYAEPTRAKRPGGLGSMGPLWKFSGANSIIGLGAGFIIPLVATWFFFRFSIADTYSGPLLAVSSMTIALAALGGPFLSRKLGTVNAIVTAQGSSTVFMFAMAFAPYPLLAGALYVARAALMNMASPLSDSFLMGIVPAEQRSLASAVNSLIWRLPNSLTTVLGGWIMASGDFGLPIFLATGLYGVGIAGFYGFFRNVKPAA